MTSAHRQTFWATLLFAAAVLVSFLFRSCPFNDRSAPIQLPAFDEPEERSDVD
jgi:hypothetical protein